MSKRTRYVLIIGISLIVLLIAIVALRPSMFAFIILQANGIRHAGTWEDDPQNWYRAFGEQKPAQVQVIHSKYWRSNHFTDEHIYFFEVEATPEWRDAFLKKQGLKEVSPSVAESFRTNIQYNDTPRWFAPDPIELYDVWDRLGYSGSVWINKTNGYIYFYDMQL